jgi:PAS domain S-box-containing protein
MTGLEKPTIIKIAAIAGLTLGLVVWMMLGASQWATIPRYLLLLPVGLTAYWFGQRPAWAVSAVGAVLNLISLRNAFITPDISPHLVEGVLAAVVLFPIGQVVARWGRSVEKTSQPSRPDSEQITSPSSQYQDVAQSIRGSQHYEGVLDHVRTDSDLGKTLNSILWSTRQLIPYDVAEITLWDEDRQCCVTKGWGGKRAYARKTEGVYYVDEGYTGWIIRHQRSLLIRDAQARRDVRPKVDTPEHPFRSYVGVPLHIGKQFLGTLEFISYQEEVYSERDVEVLQAVGGQAAVAIENAYLYAETQRRVEQQAGLARVAALASSTLNLDELLDRVMDETLQLLEAEKGALLLYDEDEEALVARYLASAGANRETVEKFRVPIDAEGFEQSIFSRGGSYICNNVQQDTNIIPAYAPHLEALNVQNFIGVAVRLKDRSIGELYLGDREGGFGREEIRVLETVAGYFATAIENSYLYDEARSRATELASLVEISAAVSGSLELEQVFQAIADALREVVGCQRSAIFVLDEGQHVLRLAMTQGYSDDYVSQSQTLPLDTQGAGGRAYAAVTGEPLIISDVHTDDRVATCAPLSFQEGVEAVADFPLKRAGRVTGLLSVAFDEPHQFTEIEIELLTAFANQAAIAIENARFYEYADDELQRRKDALNGFQRVSREINITFNRERILQVVLEEAINLSGATYGAILHRDTGEDVWELEAYEGYAASVEERVHPMPPALEKVLQTRQTLFAPQIPSPEFDGREMAGLASDAHSLLIVPIFYAKALAGMIVLESTEKDVFVPEIQGFVEGLSAQAAIAIGNERRYQEQINREELLRHRANQLALVLDVSQALRSDHPLEDVLEEIAYAVQDGVGFDLVMVSVLEGEPPYLRRVAAAGVPIPEFERMKEVQQPWSVVEDVMDEEFRISHSYYIPAEEDDIWRDRLDVYTEGSTNGKRDPGQWHPDDMLLVPLIGPGGEVRGLLSVDRPRDGRAPDHSTIAALEIFAAQAALAIKNAEMVKVLRRRAEVLTLFNEISRSATAKLDLGEVLSEVVETVPRLLSCDTSSILLRDVESGRYVPRATYGSAMGHPGEEIVARVAESGMPLVVDDTEDELDVQVGDVRALVLTPLTMADHQVVGVLCVGRQNSGGFTPAEVAMLSALSDQVSVAVDNARLFEETRRRAVQLEVASEVARDAAVNLDVDELLCETVQLISDRFDFYHAGLFLLDKRGAYAVLHAASSEGGQRMLDKGHKLAVGEVGIVGYVAESGEPRIALDVGEDAVHFINPELPDTRSEMALPLISRGEVIGVLDVQSVEEAAFTEEDVATLQTMADQLANAIENARLYEETKRRLADAELVQEVMLAAASTLDFDLVLERTIKALHRELGIGLLGFLLPDEENEVFKPHPSLVGYSDQTFEIRMKDSLAGRAYRAGRSIVVSDLAQESAAGQDDCSRSALALPVRVGGRIAAVMIAESPEIGAFGDDEVRLFTTIAGQLGVALESARLFEEVRSFSEEMEQRVEERTQELAEALEDLTEERDRVETLYRITSELSSSLDLSYVLNQAMELVVDAVGADRASTLMLDSSGQLIYRAALGVDIDLPPGGTATRFSVGEGLAGWVVEQREAVIVPDILEDPRWVEPENRDREYRSALAVPLLMGNEVLGALLLLHTAPDYFDEEHLHLVEAAAVQVAYAVNNAELYNVIQEQAKRLGGMLKAQKVEAAKSQAVLEGVADGVMVADAEGKVMLFNAAAERILGLSREEAIGRTTKEMLGLYGSQAQDWMQTIAEWAEQPEDYDAEEYLAAQLEIEDRTVSVHLAPVLMGNEFLGTVSVFRDVTAEVEADRAKTEFVSMVSHELRTPMTSIKGYTDLLMMEAVGTLTDKQRNFLSVIKGNAERLKMLVDDLLDISRIESGRMEVSPEEMQVGDVIDQAIKVMKARAEEEELTLRSNVPSELPIVQADPDRVNQILTNLLENACRYTPADGEVIVSADVQGDEVVISVRDTGIGITPEDQRKIFDRFFRAEDPVVQKAPGTGLGLSIVKSLVEMQGGQLEVESEPEEGSTFTFTLPVLTHEGDNEATEPVSTKVLVVEDDRDIANFIRLNLIDNGQRVLVAHRGEDALELAQREQPDLITLDVLLPDTDGFKVLEALKSDPATQDIPVVIVSMVPDPDEGLERGAVACISKPIDDQELLRVVRNVLVRRDPLLIVSDDGDMLRDVLRAGNFDVRAISQEQRVLPLAQEIEPSLILLDLDHSNGKDIIKCIREDSVTRNTPVVVVTNRMEGRVERVLDWEAVSLVDKSSSDHQLVEEIEMILGESQGFST